MAEEATTDAHAVDITSLTRSQAFEKFKGEHGATYVRVRDRLHVIDQPCPPSSSQLFTLGLIYLAPISWVSVSVCVCVRVCPPNYGRYQGVPLECVYICADLCVLLSEGGTT